MFTIIILFWKPLKDLIPLDASPVEENIVFREQYPSQRQNKYISVNEYPKTLRDNLPIWLKTLKVSNYKDLLEIQRNGCNRPRQYLSRAKSHNLLLELLPEKYGGLGAGLAACNEEAATLCMELERFHGWANLTVEEGIVLKEAVDTMKDALSTIKLKLKNKTEFLVVVGQLEVEPSSERNLDIKIHGFCTINPLEMLRIRVEDNNKEVAEINIEPCKENSVSMNGISVILTEEDLSEASKHPISENMELDMIIKNTVATKNRRVNQ